MIFLDSSFVIALADGGDQYHDDAGKVNGDVYNPATELLFGIVKGNPFASGVRRTEVTVTSAFSKRNGAKTEVPHDPDVLKGIREVFL